MDTYKGELFGSVVEIDMEATKSWYSKGNQWDCECVHCRNFLELARNKKLPIQILEQLNSLGIQPEQATYVCELYASEKGHLYQFSYRIAGNIIDEKSHIVPDDRGGGRCCHEPYPYGAPGFPEPHFDLNFDMILPWVINEPDK